jgi:cbb3-type cytochrome oxidase cytochrome c subunit
MSKKIKFFYVLIMAGMIGFFSQSGYGQTDDVDAKDIFLAEKCQRCHSIEELNITNTGQKDISDLSAVGSKRTAEWLVKYLRREEVINGKKHLKNLKTSGADIEKLANWLATLKGK